MLVPATAEDLRVGGKIVLKDQEPQVNIDFKTVYHISIISK